MLCMHYSSGEIFFATLSDDTIHNFKPVEMGCQKMYSQWNFFHVSFLSTPRKQLMFGERKKKSLFCSTLSQ